VPQVAKTILLVDDDEDIRRNATSILSIEGYSVHAASDGQEALDMLSAAGWQPDLIVSDISMPRINGYEFYKEVRLRSALRLVPFIFLTAYGSRRHLRIGREMGVDDYLVKPFDPDDLLAAVRNKIARIEGIAEEVNRRFDHRRDHLVQLLSHELRTPLTYITGGFELLRDGVQSGNGSQDMNMSIDLIRSGTDRLVRLAEQVVRYTELISGRAALQITQHGEMTRLADLVMRALSQAEAEAAERRIGLVFNNQLRPEAALFTVPELLTTAIYEVLRNAITFSTAGSNVHVLAYVEGENMLIVVRDQGCGIAARDQEMVWEVLDQSERHDHEQQGIGMGLPIVKQTLLLHGGDAFLESQKNVGTTVVLRLPLG
jgi:signal transduction histidine kinase